MIGNSLVSPIESKDHIILLLKVSLENYVPLLLSFLKERCMNQFSLLYLLMFWLELIEFDPCVNLMFEPLALCKRSIMSSG